jgi:hypothetical protein
MSALDGSLEAFLLTLKNISPRLRREKLWEEGSPLFSVRDGFELARILEYVSVQDFDRFFSEPRILSKIQTLDELTAILKARPKSDLPLPPAFWTPLIISLLGDVGLAKILPDLKFQDIECLPYSRAMSKVSDFPTLKVIMDLPSSVSFRGDFLRNFFTLNQSELGCLQVRSEFLALLTEVNGLQSEEIKVFKRALADKMLPEEWLGLASRMYLPFPDHFVGLNRSDLCESFLFTFPD